MDRKRIPLKKHATDFIIAFSLAYGFVLPNVAQLTDTMTRYDLHYHTTDYLYILLFTAILGSVFFLGNALLRRPQRNLISRIRFFLVGAAIGFLVVILVRYLALNTFLDKISLSGTSWKCVLGGGSLFLGALLSLQTQKMQKLARGLKNALLLFSPLPILLSLQMLNYENSFVPPERFTFPPKVNSSPEAEKRSTFLFLFDAWGYKQTFEKDRLNDTFLNLNEYLSDFTVFHQAYSPAGFTDQSIPRLLYQRNETFVAKDDGLYFKTPHGLRLCSSFPSIFQTLQSESEAQYVLGINHDYNRLLEGQYTHCAAYPFVLSRHPGWIEGLRYTLYRSSEAGRIPLLQRIFGMLSYYNDHKAWVYEQIHAEALNAIEQGKPNSIGYFHYPIPHFPYIFDRDGIRPEMMQGYRAYSEHTLENYQKNLERVDFTIKKNLDHLKSLGKYESSLIILTSDHGWREGTKKVVKHVPLFIKFPFQKEKREVKEHVELYELVRWINANTP